METILDTSGFRYLDELTSLSSRAKSTLEELAKLNIKEANVCNKTNSLFITAIKNNEHISNAYITDKKIDMKMDIFSAVQFLKEHTNDLEAYIERGIDMNEKIKRGRIVQQSLNVLRLFVVNLSYDSYTKQLAYNLLKGCK